MSAEVTGDSDPSPAHGAVPVSVWTAMASAALFVGSWPLAIDVRGFFETLGSPDLIHALKSGFVIPFLILSLGLPVAVHAKA